MKSCKFNSYILEYSVALDRFFLSFCCLTHYWISTIWRFRSNLITSWSYARKLLLDGNWSVDIVNWMHCTELFPTWTHFIPGDSLCLTSLFLCNYTNRYLFQPTGVFSHSFTQSLKLCLSILLPFKCLQSFILNIST